MPPQRMSRTEKAALNGATPQTLSTARYSRNLKTVAEATMRQYNDMRKLWLEFLTGPLEYTKPAADATLLDGAQLPSMDIVKSFLRWYAAGSTGQLGSKASLNTVENMCHLLTTTLQRDTGNFMHDGAVEDVIGYIRGALRDEQGIQHVTKEKTYADEVDLRVLMEQLWCDDLDEIESSRDRIQLAFVMQLQTFTGCRPGALLPTFHYPKLRLTYRDFELYLARDGNSAPKFRLQIVQRHMKGKKRSTDNLKIIMSEQPHVIFCPLASFFALAFADEMFESASSPEQLFAEFQEVQPGFPRRVYFKESKLSDAVLKSEKRNAYSYNMYFAMLRNLSFRAGYSRHIKPYSIRYAVANRLHEQHPGPLADVVLGHSGGTNSSTFVKHYASQISSIDVQAAMLGSRESRDIAQFRRAQRDPRRLYRLPSRLIQAVDHDPIKEFMEGNANNNRQKVLLDAAWSSHRQHRQPQLSTDIAPECSTNEETRIPNSVERFGDLRDRAARALTLQQYDHPRRIVAEAVRQGFYVLRSSNANAVLTQLIEIARPRSSAPPLVCPSDSILRCLPNFCRRCNQLQEDIEAHHQDHYNEIDLYCGILDLRQCVAVGARCPFCISNAEMSWTHRFKEMTGTGEFNAHLKLHLDRDVNPHDVRCPHPRCKQKSFVCREGLLHHFYDNHGMDSVRYLVTCYRSEELVQIPGINYDNPFQDGNRRRLDRDEIDVLNSPLLDLTGGARRTWHKSEQGTYDCEECGKSFKTSTGLGRHQNRSCSGEPEFLRSERGSYDCAECHKSFRTIKALKAHRKDPCSENSDSFKPQKSGRGTYDCANCRKSFKSIRGITIHSADCAGCAKGFADVHTSRLDGAGQDLDSHGTKAANCPMGNTMGSGSSDGLIAQPPSKRVVVAQRAREAKQARRAVKEAANTNQFLQLQRPAKAWERIAESRDKDLAQRVEDASRVHQVEAFAEGAAETLSSASLVEVIVLD